MKLRTWDVSGIRWQSNIIPGRLNPTGIERSFILSKRSMLIERLRFTSLSRIFRRKIVVMIIWGIRPQASERIMNCWGRNICREWSADRRIYDSITIKCKQQNQKKSPGSTMKRSWNFIGGAVWNASISGTATVRRAGLEPAVSCVSDRRSNHLNYLRCFRKE